MDRRAVILVVSTLFGFVSAACNETEQGTGGAGGTSSGTASATGGGGVGGCDADSGTDVLNCGGCGIQCSANNGVPICTSGICQIACASGFSDCNNSASDGCEVDLNNDPDNCGRCATNCSTSHASPECNLGTCAIASCASGWGDCNIDPADGCEVDLTTDPNNCGNCGASCMDGGCNASICGAPPTLFAAASDPSPVSLNGIAVDAASVYWTTSGAEVFKIAVAGGVPTLLAGSLPGHCVGIAVDADAAYFAAEPSLYKVPLGGGAPVVLASGQLQPYWVAIDDLYVYWVNRLPCAVSRVLKAGGTVDVLASPGGICQAGIALSSEYVFWGQNSAGIMRVPKSGGQVDVLVNVALPGGIAVDLSYIYYTTGSEVAKVPVGGGAPVVVAPMQTNAMALTIDATSVFWANYGNGNGIIMKVDKAGGTPLMLASNQEGPGVIAVDSTNVYWGLQSAANLYRTSKNP